MRATISIFSLIWMPIHNFLAKIQNYLFFRKNKKYLKQIQILLHKKKSRKETIKFLLKQIPIFFICKRMNIVLNEFINYYKLFISH